MPTSTTQPNIAPAGLSPLNGFANIAAGYFNPNFGMQTAGTTQPTVPTSLPTTQSQRQAGFEHAVKLGETVDPTGAIGSVERGATTFAPSVVQVVNDLTGKMGFMKIPAGKLLDFHNLIDDTARGIAGKTLKNGDIYHLTAKTPEQMVARGFEDWGVANTAKIPRVQPRTPFGQFDFHK